jgi:hypothetical protein
MSSLATQFLHSDLDDIPCPACGFGLWIRFAEVVARCAVLCPVCRTRIWLQDDRADVQNLGSVLESEIRRAMKGMFG